MTFDGESCAFTIEYHITYIQGTSKVMLQTSPEYSGSEIMRIELIRLSKIFLINEIQSVKFKTIFLLFSNKMKMFQMLISKLIDLR